MNNFNFISFSGKISCNVQQCFVIQKPMPDTYLCFPFEQPLKIFVNASGLAQQTLNNIPSALPFIYSFICICFGISEDFVRIFVIHRFKYLLSEWTKTCEPSNFLSRCSQQTNKQEIVCADGVTCSIINSPSRHRKWAFAPVSGCERDFFQWSFRTKHQHANQHDFGTMLHFPMNGNISLHFFFKHDKSRLDEFSREYGNLSLTVLCVSTSAKWNKAIVKMFNVILGGDTEMVNSESELNIRTSSYRHHVCVSSDAYGKSHTIFPISFDMGTLYIVQLVHVFWMYFNLFPSFLLVNRLTPYFGPASSNTHSSSKSCVSKFDFRLRM